MRRTMLCGGWMLCLWLMCLVTLSAEDAYLVDKDGVIYKRDVNYCLTQVYVENSRISQEKPPEDVMPYVGIVAVAAEPETLPKDKKTTGLRVLQVVDGSPAAIAGIKDGDILLTLNGEVLADPNLFRDKIRALKPGATVSFQLYRASEKTPEKQNQKIEAKLVPHPDAQVKVVEPSRRLNGVFAKYVADAGTYWGSVLCKDPETGKLTLYFFEDVKVFLQLRTLPGKEEPVRFAIYNATLVPPELPRTKKMAIAKSETTPVAEVSAEEKTETASTEKTEPVAEVKELPEGWHLLLQHDAEGVLMAQLNGRTLHGKTPEALLLAVRAILKGADLQAPLVMALEENVSEKEGLSWKENLSRLGLKIQMAEVEKERTFQEKWNQPEAEVETPAEPEKPAETKRVETKSAEEKSVEE